MNWNTLICDKRFGLEHYHDPKKSALRSDFRRDYDRLVFSSPFRRLQNKTQVFPLPGSIFVHNRLTHSMEVACVGKSLADRVADTLRERYGAEPWAHKLNALGDITAAACLAHDLGNPPFGHSGEKAIATFFSEGAGAYLQERLSPAEWRDITTFEGNANTFRVLTHQFKGRRAGGFAMTYSTLAAIVKYPYESSLATRGKFGFFTSERDDFVRVAETLGMKRLPSPDGTLRYARHPLVFLVEAADDICYEVMDIEDAHKLKILSTTEVIDAFMAFFDDERQAHMRDVMDTVEDPNEKVAYLRSCVIGVLVDRCAEAFLRREQDILEGTFQASLLSDIDEREREGYRRCTRLSWARIYTAGSVVDVELAGNRIITYLMEKLIRAVTDPDLNYSRLLLAKFPQQYDVEAPSLYGKIQAVLDHISAMTDVYALNLYRTLEGTSLPAV
ncbi:MAG: dNTP triphosphohydrolase [Muribaculaceae bacterium]|nr:dNTP triphosphohydrolase [Muribaculaceae bacterium]